MDLRAKSATGEAMTSADMIALAERFQPLIASILALTAAIIAFYGATAGTRYNARRDRKAAESERWRRIYELEELLGSFILVATSARRVGKVSPDKDEFACRVKPALDILPALAAKFENYARYTPYLPAEAMTKLRGLCFHARMAVQARKAFLDAKTPESTAETRAYFSAVCDDVANTATDVAKILDPLIASRGH